MNTAVAVTSLRDTAVSENDTNSENSGIPGEIIHEAPDRRFHGEMVGKIISSRYYADKNTSVADFANALARQENIYAVGIVDAKRRVVGIISRKELFDNLSKPFGRDLWSKKTLEQVMERSAVFPYSRNILSISQEISHSYHSTKNIFYLLVMEDGTFAGIFTNKDMLIYLSDLTGKDIMLAKKLQAGIVPDHLYVNRPECSIVGSSAMAKGIGGDFYNMVNFDEGRWLLAVCDVSGKGVSASLVSVLIGGMMGIYDFKNGMENFISYLNRYLFQHFENEKFVTGLFMEFDERTGMLSLIDMGHSYAYIYRDNKMIRLKSSSGSIPLGIVEEIGTVKSTVRLKKDDMLIVMTDGFEEQKNIRGDEYGLNRFFRVIHRNGNLDLADIRDAVYADINVFRGGHPQQDDMTLIMLKFKGDAQDTL